MLNGGNIPQSWGRISVPPEEAWQPWLDYVYLWICNAPGGTYVKVGVTNNPDRRSREFRTNSPFKGAQRYVCQVPDRASALRVESAILSAYGDRRRHGEWLTLEAKKMAALVVACTAIARKETGLAVRFRELLSKSARHKESRTASVPSP